MRTVWHERLAAFKKYYGYTNADLARMSGNTLQSVKNISQGEVPGWLKFTIQVWENNSQKTCIVIYSIVNLCINSSKTWRQHFNSA